MCELFQFVLCSKRTEAHLNQLTALVLDECVHFAPCESSERQGKSERRRWFGKPIVTQPFGGRCSRTGKIGRDGSHHPIVVVDDTPVDNHTRSLPATRDPPTRPNTPCRAVLRIATQHPPATLPEHRRPRPAVGRRRNPRSQGGQVGGELRAAGVSRIHRDSLKHHPELIRPGSPGTTHEIGAPGSAPQAVRPRQGPGGAPQAGFEPATHGLGNRRSIP